jgi:hypothetical protein
MRYSKMGSRLGVLAGLALLAAVLHHERAAATTCDPPVHFALRLLSVKADGVDVTGHQDASVGLYTRGPGVVEIAAKPTVAHSAIWKETYHVAPAPSAP